MFWKRKVAPKRAYKELLRENLNTIAVDVFYGDDPLVYLQGEDRKLYLKKFNDLMKDADILGRFMYLINKQANLTLKSMKDSNDENANMAGSMNINGIALVKEDFERLSNTFLKEDIPPEKFNRFDVV